MTLIVAAALSALIPSVELAQECSRLKRTARGHRRPRRKVAGALRTARSIAVPEHGRWPPAGAAHGALGFLATARREPTRRFSRSIRDWAGSSSTVSSWAVAGSDRLSLLSIRDRRSRTVVRPGPRRAASPDRSEGVCCRFVSGRRGVSLDLARRFPNIDRVFNGQLYYGAGITVWLRPAGEIPRFRIEIRNHHISNAGTIRRQPRTSAV